MTNPTLTVVKLLGLLAVLDLLALVALAALDKAAPDVLVGLLPTAVAGLLGLLAPRPELLVQPRPSADNPRGRHQLEDTP